MNQTSGRSFHLTPSVFLNPPAFSYFSPPSYPQVTVLLTKKKSIYIKTFQGSLASICSIDEPIQSISMHLRQWITLKVDSRTRKWINGWQMNYPCAWKCNLTNHIFLWHKNIWLRTFFSNGSFSKYYPRRPGNPWEHWSKSHMVKLFHKLELFFGHTLFTIPKLHSVTHYNCNLIEKTMRKVKTETWSLLSRLHYCS